MQAIRSSYLVATAAVLLLAVLGAGTFLAYEKIIAAADVITLFGVITGFVGTLTTAHVVATNTSSSSGS
jgi:hypothetical protein